MQIATPSPCPVCGCVRVCVCVPVCEHVCVFALRAIDIGFVNPILSTSLQQQDIIHKTNINMHVVWHTHTSTHTHTPTHTQVPSSDLSTCQG